ncbi:hypothetical protein CKA38_06530 [Ereboglobus luteus]|uniref:Uncharacterized protein n=1 Tax=Ereboglobus luteus TaxID=1796921 RepID=A0A2U8E240_9BACT|nr:hypothetical protein CKA38_06530 [Ereboglobus luteus]
MTGKWRRFDGERKTHWQKVLPPITITPVRPKNSAPASIMAVFPFFRVIAGGSAINCPLPHYDEL